jgi:tetratricopeptide (TPR) repeat protein
MRIIVFIFIAISYNIQCKSQSASQWVDKGLAETDHQKKIEYYSNAIKLDPKEFMAYYQRGRTFYHLGKSQEAILDFNEAIKIYPINQAYHQRGRAYKSLSRFNEAILDFDAAIKLDPKFIYSYYERGNANIGLGKFQEAILDYNEAIKLDRKFNPAYVGRGHAYSYIEKFDEAILDFDEAIKLEPKYLDAYIRRGGVYSHIGKFDEAIHDFDEAIKLDPKYAMAYNLRGIVKHHTNFYEEAINDYDISIRLDPTPSNFSNRGNAKNKLNRFEDAILDFDKAISLDEKAAQPYRGRAYSYFKLNKIDVALRDIETAITLDPKDARAYIYRGMIYFNLGKKIDALNELNTANKLIPEIGNYSIQNDAEKLANELVGMLNSSAQEKQPVSIKTNQNLKKVALVIGVKSYTAVPPLTNTLNDAKDIATSLRSKGFEVIELLDPKTKNEMRNAAIRFSKALEDFPDGIGMLYYSGHGMQIDGANYLIPAAATLEVKADVQEQCMDMDYFLRIMESNGNHLNIVVLDACRNNPFRSFSRAADKGLSMVSAPKGSYIVYSTKPGSVASDGVGRNGLFTSKLLKYLNEPDLSIEQVFKRVAADVSIDSNDSQRPWIASDYTGEFYFNRKSGQ